MKKLMGDQAPYVSTGCFKSKSVSEIVSLALDFRLHRIELSSGTAWAPDPLDAIRKTSGNPVNYLVHNYFPSHRDPFVLNLASADDTTLRRSRDHCRAAIDLCQEFNAPFFSVHAGFAFQAKPENLGRDVTQLPRVSLEEAQKTFVDSLRDLCAYGQTKQVRVLVENNVVHPFNLIEGQNRVGLCATAEDMRRTRKEVGASNLGFLIDVGHLKVTANSLGFDRDRFLDDVGPHIEAFHLSDNDGTADRNLPFGIDAWFLPRFVDFPQATMVLEAYALDVPVIVETCRVIERAHQRVPAV